MGGLTRPVGPVRIRKTDLRTPDVLVARLSGCVRAEVATVREGEKYFVVAPERLGGIQEIPADSLTDCLHAAVFGMNHEFRRSARRKNGKH